MSRFKELGTSVHRPKSARPRTAKTKKVIKVEISDIRDRAKRNPKISKQDMNVRLKHECEFSLNDMHLIKQAPVVFLQDIKDISQLFQKHTAYMSFCCSFKFYILNNIRV